jgi:AcrR family transcriptional regulator
MPASNSSTAPVTVRPVVSQRRLELLEAAYRYVLEYGLTGFSLRPLASAIGSSPRVLLFLFGSKEGLVREVLARARADELQLLDRIRGEALDARTAAQAVWGWLIAAEHRSLLKLWMDTYTRSLLDPDGPWADFAAATVREWLGVFADLDVGPDDVDRTLLLAVLRGSLLDLLATQDLERTTAAVNRYLTPGADGG